MNKRFLKRVISIALAILLIALCIPTAFAQTSSDDEIAGSFEYGAVLVAMKSGSTPGLSTLLPGFEIESTRLLTPGSDDLRVDHVTFVEKTREIVEQAVAILNASPYVEIAEPNWYGSYLPIGDPVIVDPDSVPGSILVTVQLGEPRSIARARNIVKNALGDDAIESIGMLLAYQTYAIVRVQLKDMTDASVQKAIATLEQISEVDDAKQDHHEYDFAIPDDFEPGTVIISGSYGNLLDDFEIESIHLLTPGSGREVYEVRFKDKTKEIVWRALEILEVSPSVEYAEANYYLHCCNDGPDPQTPTEAPTEPDDPLGFGPGEVLINIQTPSSKVATARAYIKNMLRDFDVEAVELLASTESNAIFLMTLAEKTDEAASGAIAVLRQDASVNYAKLNRGELRFFEPDLFEPGSVIVSGTGYERYLDGYAIEETRLLTPGSGRSVYLIKFKEKTKDIVWEVLEILESHSIEACPDYYRYFDEEPDPQQPTDPQNPSEHLFLDRLYALHPDLPEVKDLDAYEEPYYHYNADGEIDWAIVYVCTLSSWDACDVEVCGILGGRVVWLPLAMAPFTTGYAVYDVAEDAFYDVFDITGAVDTVFDRYDGLDKAFRSIDVRRISPSMLLGGGLLGDANGDRSVDIFDVTHTQRCLAKMLSRYCVAVDNADLDGDGELSIFDATLAQRKIAKMDGTDDLIDYAIAI